MNFPLLLCLFWPMVLSHSVPEHSENVTLWPNTEPSIFKQKEEGFSSSTSIPLDTTVHVTNKREEFDLGMQETEFDWTDVVTIFLRNQKGDMAIHNTTYFFGNENDTTKMRSIYRNLKLPEGVDQLLMKNGSCILSMSKQLNCSWTTMNSPACAQYSVIVFQKGENATRYDCDIKQGHVECHGSVKSDRKQILTHINVSCTNFWYIHTLQYDPKDIEKLNPPQNINTSFTSESLRITWEPPNKKPKYCFRYEIRINNEMNSSNETNEYEKRDVDLTKSYSVQMRVTKTKHCRENHIWSDWSGIFEVTPYKNPYELNAVVITVIALGIPMFLLAVLLLFKCHRVFEKLFPVPSPSTKIKYLLEKDDFIKVVPSKYIEEVTELQFVGVDEYVKISL